MHTFSFYIPLIAAVVVALAIGFIIGFFSNAAADNWMETQFDTTHGTGVDPWAMQRAIMAASSQDLPAYPTLTRGSLLYGALNMEELGETLVALATCMVGIRPQSEVLRDIHWAFRRYGRELQEHAAMIRSQIALAQDFEVPLSDVMAVELLDGGTDLVVVTAGLMNATGLPGAAAYEEVSASNLSKRNPVTGVIDKTPDGKWIKGANYQMPDLHAVLREHAESPLSLV